MADINNNMKVTITAEDKASSVFKSLEGSLKGIEDELTTIRNFSAVAFAGLTAAIGFSAHAAIEAEDSLNKAGSAVRVAGQDWDLYRSKLQEVTAVLQEHTRFSDDDFQRAFAQVVNITGDAGRSLENLSLISDVATARNLDLSTAADAVGKAMQGQIGRLGVLFPELQRNIEALGDTATDSERAAVAVGYLSSKFKGLAEQDAKSAAGQLAILKHQFEELREAIGGGFINSVAGGSQRLTEFIRGLTEWVRENQGLVASLAIAGIAVTGFLTVVTGIGLVIPSLIRGLEALEIAILHVRVAMLSLSVPSWLVTLAPVLAGLALPLYAIGKSIYEVVNYEKMLDDASRNAANSLIYLKNNLPIDAIGRYKDALGLTVKETASFNQEIDKGLDKYRSLTAFAQQWTPLFSSDAEAARKYREELKRLADEQARMQLAHNLLGFEAPSWQEQVSRLRGNRSQSFEGIMPQGDFNKLFEGLDKSIEKTKELSASAKQLGFDFAQSIGYGVGRVVAGVTSMARLTALSIKDIFRAVGEEILALFSRVLAQLIATGILKLLLSILNPASLVIPTGGGFPDAFGGSGLASIPRGGGQLIPSVVTPQQNSFGGGGLGGGGHIYNINIGRFIGTQENARELGREIRRMERYGQL